MSNPLSGATDKFSEIGIFQLEEPHLDLLAAAFHHPIYIYILGLFINDGFQLQLNFTYLSSLTDE